MVNKYNVHWQIVRTKARKEKGAEAKVKLLMDWLQVHSHRNNRARVKNWLIMSRMGYKDQTPKVYYSVALEQLEVFEWTVGDEDNDLTKISDKDLLLIHKDLKNRKWGFQYEMPQSHITFMERLEDELYERDIY